MLLAVISVESKGAVLTATCKYQSGLSTYVLKFDLTAGSGDIRYRFMDQDVFYTAHIQQITDSELRGIAVFSRSNSGETKGNPFNFVFNIRENVFYELNVSAPCD